MKKILLVDDEVVGMGALKTLLELDGYEVTACSSSVEALERLPAERFDAMVTDLEMPHVHGLDLVQRARACSVSTLILIVTGYAGSPAAEAALALGAKRVFPKPVVYEQLLEELQRSLGGGEG